MSYNSKDRTSYVYDTLKSQNATVKVLENSSSEEFRYDSEDTIDLGRGNMGVGGFYDYIINNIDPDVEFYGIFNNDVYDISHNFMEEHHKFFDSDVGIVHSSLDDPPFARNHTPIGDINGSLLYLYIENVIPFYNYDVLSKYKALLEHPIKQHYYGYMDKILSNISNSMNYKNIIIKNCKATHERSGVRKSVSGNYTDYLSNCDRSYSEFLQNNPKLLQYT